MGTGKEKKTWSEDIRPLMPKENAIFITLESLKKKNRVKI